MWEGSKGFNKDCGEGDIVDEIETSTFTTFNHMTILKSVVTSILIGCMVGFLLLFQQVNSTVLVNFGFIYFIISIVTSLISPYFIAKLSIRTPIIILPILMVGISCIMVYVNINWIQIIISFVFAPILCELFWNSLGGYVISYGHKENLYFNFGIIFGISSIFLNVKLYTNYLNTLLIISGLVSIISSIVLAFLCRVPISEQLDENNKSLISYLSSLITNIKSINPIFQLLFPPVIFIGYFQLVPIADYSRGLSTSQLYFEPFGYNLTNVLTGLISFLIFGSVSSHLMTRKILLLVNVIFGIFGCCIVLGYSYFIDSKAFYYLSTIFTLIPTNYLIIITYTAIGSYFSDSPLFGFALIRVFYNIGSLIINVIPFYISNFGVYSVLFLLVTAFIFTLIHTFKLNDSQLNSNKYYQVSKATWI